MKAVVWHGIGDIRLDDVAEPTIQDPHDAIVQVTGSAICGTDLHFIRGTVAPMKEGEILGHEGVGVVRAVGDQVRGFRPGDRVLVNSSVSCGACWYCRQGRTSQCDVANTNGPKAGTAFFGGPTNTGPIDGLQAEYVRVPWAQNSMHPLPDNVSDDQAILLTDMWPTAWFGAELAGIGPGDVVAVLGAGGVGQFAVASAYKMGAGRVIVVDHHQSRLDLARGQGAEAVNFDEEDPVEAINELTNGIGADAVIDCVGQDSELPETGPAATRGAEASQFYAEARHIAPDSPAEGFGPEHQWKPGTAPSLAARWSVDAVAKYGRLSIMGVYSPRELVYPIGQAMNKNLTVRMGNCDHHTVTPQLIDMVAAGQFDPTSIITQREPMHAAIDAYKSFDLRENGWTKVEIADPSA